MTGWYQDTDGNRYYLNPSPDGTQGRMLTGWNWIDGQCLYFEEESNGTRGALRCNAVLPDGKQTNEEWCVDLKRRGAAPGKRAVRWKRAYGKTNGSKEKKP